MSNTVEATPELIEATRAANLAQGDAHPEARGEDYAAMRSTLQDDAYIKAMVENAGSVEFTNSVLTKDLPGFKLEQWTINGRKWFNGVLSVLASVEGHDGEWWIHVSACREKSVPTYADLKMLKEKLIGPDRTAIQLFPKASQHVNAHNYVLHLWARVSGDSLPDFTRGFKAI